MASPENLQTTALHKPPTAKEVLATQREELQEEAADHALATDLTQAPYAIGYQEAIALKLNGQHAKFFAQAFAAEYENALAQQLPPAQALSYATDYAGPYALAFMAFVKENSDLISASKIMSEAHSFATTHVRSYEDQFTSLQHEIFQIAAKKEKKRLDAEAKAKAQKEEEDKKQALYLKAEKKKSESKGYTKGYADGMKAGKLEFFPKGEDEGYQKGHIEGHTKGYESAITLDYEDGKRSGKKEAYKNAGFVLIPFILISAILTYLQFV